MNHFSRKRLAASITIALFTPALPDLAQSAGLPTGGSIVAGSGNISQDGQHMAILQHSNRMISNWQDFSISAGNSVTFHQPSSSSVALNRVIGGKPSEILGNLSANGQVFLLNPNGVMIGKSGSVRAGGFVASTLELSDADFLGGNYRFRGEGGGILNQGRVDGALVALIAPTVRNEGAISGDTALAAGTDVLLDFNGDGLLSVEVKASTLATLVDNKGLIQADGGTAILTARGASRALQGLVNNSGTVQAQSLAEKDGRILLLGDMTHGEVNVAGTLDASAPRGGDGGFIDTSAARVNVGRDVHVTTNAPRGETGTWLIDPTDFTISAGSAARTDSGIGADTLSANLADTNITLATVDTGDEAGNIYVNGAVSWNAATQLTLEADNDIFINAPITVAHAVGGLALYYGGSGYHLAAPVSFTAGSGGSFNVNGDSYTLIHDANQLQAMNNDLTGLYALAANIDASATAGWNGGAGFLPVGNLGTSTDDRFSGIFEGLGHVITDLTIKRPGRSNAGLFGYTYRADIRHVGLENARVTGNETVGALVGRLQNGSTITRSYVTGTVTGSDFIGGLVGYNSYGGSIVQSYSTAAVSGTGYVGGLAGYQNNDGLIRQSYSAGTVTGANNVGGLVGAGGGPIEQSFFATTDAYGNSTTGGYTNTSDEGRTLAELQSLGTFAGWNIDIDTRGGTGAAWRIYDGHSTPLLRTFMTPLTIDVSGEIQNLTYNGVAQFASGSRAISESHDSSLLFGNTYYSGSGTNAGVYAIGLDGLYSSQQGYDLIINEGSLIIAKASATVTANSNVVTYTGGEQSVSGFTVTGLVGSEDQSVLTGVTTTGGAGTNAGVYAHVASGSDQNYELTFVDGTLTVEKASATVIANSDTLTYNGDTQTVSGFTATGLVGGEDESVLTGVSTSGGVGINAGSYIHSASGSDANYELTFVDGALTINKAAATVIANSDTVTYNGDTQSVSGFTAIGLVGGEDESVLTGVTTSGGVGINAGSYIHSASGSDGNYELTFVDGALTINKAALTVFANSATVTYNGDEQNVIGYGVSGLVGGEDASVLTGITTSGGVGTNAGSYLHSASGSDDNYELTFIDGTLTINKAALTVTANDAIKTYDGLAYSGGDGVSYSGFVGGEDQSVLGGSLSFGGSALGAINAGDYFITASGLSADNYQISYIDGSLTVNKALATVTANSDAVIYNGDSQSVSGFTATGLVHGEDESVLTGVSTSGGVGINAGSYIHSVSGSDANYELTFVDGALTINKAAATVIANSDTVTYNGDTQSVSGFTAIGLVGGEDESVLTGVTTSGGVGINAGSYIHSASGSNGNYELTFVDGALTINRAAATVIANSATVTYNGDTQTVTGFTATGLVEGEDESVLTGVSTSGGIGINAGSYAHRVSGADENYELTFVDGVLTIEKAALTLSAVGDTRIYDGTIASSGAVVVSGLMTGDSIDNLSQSFDSKKAGSRSLLVNENYALNDGNGGNNYTVFRESAAGSIRPKAITGTIVAEDKIYDGTVATTTQGTLSGVIAGDDLFLNTSGEFIDKNVGGGKIVNLSANLIGDDAGNYELAANSTATATITPASLILSAVSDAKVHDGGLSSSAKVSVRGLIEGDRLSKLSQSFDSPFIGPRTLLVDSGYRLEDGNDGNNYRVNLESASGFIMGSGIDGGGLMSAAASDRAFEPDTGNAAASPEGLLTTGADWIKVQTPQLNAINN